VTKQPLWADEDREEERAASDPELVVDIDGFEGPLDLLLYFARTQKVDLAQISILALVEQYLDFVAHYQQQAQKLRLELAADYLVMAAWLAYLKSRLLLPKTEDESEASGEELAEQLQFRLQRLEAMREAARQLFKRSQLGRDIFCRGAPEMVVVERKKRFHLSLYELLTAYTGLRQRNAASQVEVGGRSVWSLKEARDVLERLVGHLPAQDWTILATYLLAHIPNEKERVSALASGFAASLEMVREGMVEIRQNAAFAPLYVRARKERE